MTPDFASLARLFNTDESRFCLDFHDGRRRVWRQKNERFKNCCVAEHDRFGGAPLWFGVTLAMMVLQTSMSSAWQIEDGNYGGVQLMEVVQQVF
jgi:hypothetical protein